MKEGRTAAADGGEDHYPIPHHSPADPLMLPPEYTLRLRAPIPMVQYSPAVMQSLLLVNENLLYKQASTG